uniref:cation transporter n=1 Tax=Pontibacterium sp. TaxID=2036026 RepID=UPI00356B5CD7
ELALGIFAQSTGLIADSLDMFADAAVYGISYFAVGAAKKKQADAARISGYLQVLLGVAVMVEVLRRIYFGSEPESTLIMVVGGIALAANLTCLSLISKHRDGGVHMRASWIFSTNDVIANLGVIIAGILVSITGNHIPDLVIGSIISLIVVRGGVQILQEAEQTATKSNSTKGS